jgi:pyridoxamine 5'-phosphate oxidase
MTMELDDYIKFANENPISYLATADSDQPRVRGLLLWFADKTGLYYNIGAMKEVYKQLKAHPKVEVCFFNSKSKSMDQMRVTGQVEFLNDLDLKKKLVEARPFLKQWGLTPESSNLILFRVAKCKAYLWTIETNTQPKQYISFG